MDMYKVGMETASAAIHKLNSFQLLAVCYWEEHWKKGKKKAISFYFLQYINLALSSGMVKWMTAS